MLSQKVMAKGFWFPSRDLYQLSRRRKIDAEVYYEGVLGKLINCLLKNVDESITVEY